MEVEDEGERIAHIMAAPLPVDEAGEVDCRIDWNRRFDHMQQHSGQHLLSAVFAGQLGIATVSFHLGQESSTIDLETATLDPARVIEIERAPTRPSLRTGLLAVSFEDAAETSGLRKPSGREGTLRIISIEGLDRSACGGTHVSRTGEIGPILLRKLEKIRNTTRVEFLCGGRAIARARADFGCAIASGANILRRPRRSSRAGGRPAGSRPRRRQTAPQAGSGLSAISRPRALRNHGAGRCRSAAGSAAHAIRQSGGSARPRPEFHGASQSGLRRGPG